jgi:hypothetical protein
LIYFLQKKSKMPCKKTATKKPEAKAKKAPAKKTKK